MMLSALFVLLGVLAGLGLILIAHGWRATRPTGFEQRVAPWVSDISAQAHLVVLDELRRKKSLSSPRLSRVVNLVPSAWAQVIAGSDRAQTLLNQSGRHISISAWRASVIEAGILGAVSGAITGILIVLSSQAGWALVFALALLGAATTVVLKRYLLSRQAHARVLAILDELPIFCELLAICLTAGESFREGLSRVVEHGSGPLAQEFRTVLAQSQLGVPASAALAELSERLRIAPVSRMIDHVISSMDRGAPLADVLRTQATDARAEAGQRLQERASSREVVMLLPLVFLILPITIAFAIFPGLLVIQAGL